MSSHPRLQREASASSWLFINVARIGDTLLCIPAIRAVAESCVGATIDVLAHPGRAEALENLPFVASVGTISKRQAWLRGWVRPRQYDYALVYGHDAALIQFALRVAKRVVAFEQEDPRQNKRLFRSVREPPPLSMHAVHHRLLLTEALGIPPVGLRLSYHPTPDELCWADATLNKDVPRNRSPLVGLHVATFPKKTFRRWPIEKFAELAHGILKILPDAHFLIFGGNEEPDQVKWLGKQLGSRATAYAGRISLRQSGALMSRLGLFVGLDSGPSHLASAFDYPMVLLHHCLIPSRIIAPLQHPCCVPVDHPRLAGGHCSEQVSMDEITVDQVIASVEQALMLGRSGR